MASFKIKQKKDRNENMSKNYKIEKHDMINRINKPDFDYLKKLVKLVNYWQGLSRNKEKAQIIKYQKIKTSLQTYIIRGYYEQALSKNLKL